MADPKREAVYLKIIISIDAHEKIAKFREEHKADAVSEVMIQVQVGDGETHEIECTLSDFLDRMNLGTADKIIKSRVR